LLKNKYQEKKKVILFLSVLILFAFTMSGCNWFGEGILNVFDPKAQIRVNFTEILFAEGEGTIDLEIYSLNQVEFIGEGFSYKYYNNGVLLSELSKTVGTAFYVQHSDTPGTPGPITEIENLPLYYKEVVDYVAMNPLITEITCTISLIGTDGAGHGISKSVTVDFPAVQPGVDFEPPNAVINVTPGTTGNEPFTVQFDASQSTDNRGIASYSWDFGDGTTGTGVLPTPHTYTCGNYVVRLTATDHWGNVGYDTVIINVGETGGPSVDIQVTPSPPEGNVPFTVYFDASGSEIDPECGVGEATYNWDFGDGSTGTGVTTSHTYTENGIYTVILTVTDSEGNVGYGSVVVTVGIEIEVNAVIETTPDPPTGTTSLTVGFNAAESTTSASGATIISYSWDFDGDGVADEVHSEDPPIPVESYTFSGEGTYLVQLTVEDSKANIGYAFVSIKVNPAN
jgi:PKD repeat protein